MSATEHGKQEGPTTYEVTTSDEKILGGEHKDAYGQGHLLHTAPQILIGLQRGKHLANLQGQFGATFEITDPQNDIVTITANYKQQLFSGDKVETTTVLTEPSPQQKTQEPTFKHKIIKDSRVAFLATVTCSADNENREELQPKKPEEKRWQYLNTISTKEVIEQNGNEPHYTDSQHLLNGERMRIFEVFGMELFAMAQKHGFRGFVRYMEVEYKRQPQPGEIVEVITDLYVENRRKKLRYYQQIKTIEGEVITEAIFDCVLVSENGLHADIPELLTQPLIDARKTDP